MGFKANIIGAGHKQLFAALAVAIVVGGCGDGGGAGGTTPAPAPPPPPPNQAPVAALAIPPQSLTIGTPIMLNLAEHFSDPDGDQLTFTATTGSVTPTVGECVVVNHVISIPEGGSCRISSATVDMYRLSSLGIAPGDAASCSDGRISAGGISVGTLSINGLTIQCGSGAPTGAAAGAGEVSVSVSGSVLTLTPVREGNATVEVVATDPRGASASQSFSVTVERPNEAPRVSRGIRDQTLTEEGQDVNLDLDDYFSDPDGDRLEFRATSDSTSVVSVRVSGSNLRLSPRREGSATVEVVARDPAGLTASQSFDVTVEPAGPNLTLEPGSKCELRRVGGDPEFVVSGTVTARSTVTNVIVNGCVRPKSAPSPDCTSSSRYYIGRDSLGTISRGTSEDFEVSGLPSSAVVQEIIDEGTASCSVGITWRNPTSSETTSTLIEIESPLRRN